MTEGSLCMCVKSELECIKPTTCIKMTEQCFCLDCRCAFPCDDEVPCALTVLGLTCCLNWVSTDVAHVLYACTGTGRCTRVRMQDPPACALALSTCIYASIRKKQLNIHVTFSPSSHYKQSKPRSQSPKCECGAKLAEDKEEGGAPAEELADEEQEMQVMERQ